MTEPICRCGHAKHTHEHYRRGTDCSRCTCRKFRRPSLWTRLKNLKTIEEDGANEHPA